MSGRISKLPLRLRIRKHKRTPPGSSPGIIHPAEDANVPRFFITSYGVDQHLEQPVFSLNDIHARIAKFPDLNHWVEVRGFGSRAVLEQLCSDFDIHLMEMEDVVNTYQRPKMEEHKHHLFVVSRVISRCVDQVLKNDQLSLFIGKKIIISMQEHYDDYYEPVRSRLRGGKGLMRMVAIDYLAYSMLDAVVDTYFPLLEYIGEKLDELEDELFDKPNRESLHKIQSIKRELIMLRRTVFAERDKINDLLRTSNDFMSDQTKLYVKDTYDHTIQVMDLVESYKEITASLMDIYLSSVSNRMNQIMKVLAVISTIFIPLTFIVGVYGMNFSNVDPVSNKLLPLNMPELYSPYGYLGVVLFMLALVVFQLLVFWKKGWLDKS